MANIPAERDPEYHGVAHRFTKGTRLLPMVPWPRLPDAADLPRDPPPTGLRPPNKCMWAHDPSEFRFISRFGDSMKFGGGIIQTLWSRSQIASFENNYTHEIIECLFDDPSRMPAPRRRRPWPVLKLPRAVAMRHEPPLGLIDEGSDHDEELSLEIAMEDDSDVEHEVSTLPDDPKFPSYIPWECKDAGWKEHVVDRVIYRSGNRRRTRLIVKMPRRQEEIVDPPNGGEAVYARSEGDADEAKNVAVDFRTSLGLQNPEEDVKDEDVVMSEAQEDTGGDDHDEVENADVEQDQDQGAVADEEQDQDEDSDEDEYYHRRTPTPVIKRPKLPDEYSTRGIPILQEKIPRRHLPHTLLVHDPYNASMGQHPTDDASLVSTEPIVYKRVYPAPDDAFLDNVAHIYLNPDNILGNGRHSNVYSAPLELPPPLSTYDSASVRPGVVRVAAKVSLPEKHARELLNNEGDIYNTFPGFFTEEYCGWHVLTPFVKTPTPSCQVVPKFFGFYVPDKKSKQLERDADGKLLWPWQRRSPILLMEDCGTPIDLEEMSVDQRCVILHVPTVSLFLTFPSFCSAECYSLIIRLHFQDFHHNSFRTHSILVQPGPLILPPHLRSMDRPSFRCINFSRTQTEKKWTAKEIPVGTSASKEEKERVSRAFDRSIQLEWHHARQQLGFDVVSAI